MKRARKPNLLHPWLVAESSPGYFHFRLWAFAFTYWDDETNIDGRAVQFIILFRRGTAPLYETYQKPRIWVCLGGSR